MSEEIKKNVCTQKNKINGGINWGNTLQKINKMKRIKINVFDEYKRQKYIKHSP